MYKCRRESQLIKLKFVDSCKCVQSALLFVFASYLNVTGLILRIVELQMLHSWVSTVTRFAESSIENYSLIYKKPISIHNYSKLRFQSGRSSS